MNYVRVLTESQVGLHAEQTHALWGKKATPTRRLQALTFRLRREGPDFFMSGLVDQNGALIASLKRYYFPFQRGSQTLRAVGLGAVFTHPAHRGKGYAERLIRNVLEEEGHALLFSDIETAYYTKLGFQVIPGAAQNFHIAVDSHDHTPPPFTLEPTTDVAGLLVSYRRSRASFRLWLPRTPRTWRLFREINDLDHDHWLMERGESRGYVTYRIRNGYLFLVEAVCENGPAFWTTLRAIARAAGCAEIRGWAGPGWPKISGSAPVILRPRENAVPMLRAPNLEAAELHATSLSPADHY